MHRSSRSIIILLSALVLLAGVGPVQAGNPGESGELFLRMGIGAREAAMGDAGVASSTGAAALFYNPANNVFADFQTQLVLQHYGYLGVADQEAAAVAHWVGDGVLGVIFSGVYYETQERRDEERVGEVLGTFEPYDVSIGLSYARKIGERFGLGVNAKLVHSEIDLYSDTGLAFDVFASHQAMIEGLVFGASATNLGGDLVLHEDVIPLPTSYRVGAAFTPQNQGLLGRTTFVGDIAFPNDTKEKGHFGCEVRIIPELVLRGGTRVNFDNQGWTAGAGFNPLPRLTVDYAYQNSKLEGFDDGHKFSLVLNW